LRNKEEFFNPFGDELFCFASDGFDSAASVFAPHLRDDAEGAGVITAFGDFDVGEVFWGEAPAGGIEVGDVNGQVVGHEVFGGRACGPSEDTAYNGGDFFELVEADEGIDFGEFPGEFGGEALGHAACDDEALIGAATMEATIAVGLEDGGDAFGFGRVDEGAGINDKDVGFGGVGGEFHAGGAKVAEHNF
jgi:hypothetical protein